MTDIYLGYYRDQLVRKANEKLGYNNPYQDIKTVSKITAAIDEKVAEERQRIKLDNLAQISKIKAQL